MNTIETVQAAIDALEASAPLRWRDEAKHDAVRAKHSSATAGLRSLLAQMQTEPIKAGSLDDALYSPDGSFGGAQSPTPVAPTFDAWWENHGKYNALFKFDHNASPSDRLARAKELMNLSWEVARESPAPVAVQPSQWQDIEPKWIVNDQGELGVEVAGRFFFLYKARNIEYGTNSDGVKDGVAIHEDGSPMLYRMVGKREFGETCQPLEQFRERWPGGQGATYLEPLVYTPGLSFGKPDDGAWKPLPSPLSASPEDKK